MTTSAGFFLASHGNINWQLFVAIIAGTSLVIASACVTNNYIDREIDKKMLRTKKRSLVIGDISTKNAISYAIILGLSGFLVLLSFTNSITSILGLAAFLSYVVVYGWVKRRSVHGTLVGTVPGALPPVAGYTSVTNQIDSAAVILFLILVCWQMAHFYAIAIFRMNDYKAADIPVLPIKKGIKNTKIQILIYTIGFMITASLLTIFNYASYLYLVVILIISLRWLQIAVKGFETKNNVGWARSLFGFSLIVLLAFSVIVSIDSTLV